MRAFVTLLTVFWEGWKLRVVLASLIIRPTLVEYSKAFTASFNTIISVYIIMGLLKCRRFLLFRMVRERKL